MRINKNEARMILAIINMYLKEHSWKDLENFRTKLIDKMFIGGSNNE